MRQALVTLVILAVFLSCRTAQDSKLKVAQSPQEQMQASKEQEKSVTVKIKILQYLASFDSSPKIDSQYHLVVSSKWIDQSHIKIEWSGTTEQPPAGESSPRIRLDDSQTGRDFEEHFLLDFHEGSDFREIWFYKDRSTVDHDMYCLNMPEDSTRYCMNRRSDWQRYCQNHSDQCGLLERKGVDQVSRQTIYGVSNEACSSDTIADLMAYAKKSLLDLKAFYFAQIRDPQGTTVSLEHVSSQCKSTVTLDRSSGTYEIISQAKFKIIDHSSGKN